MKTPAIVMGEPDSVLRLPKARLRNPENWTQMDSDIIAHLIQVHSQIQNSRWLKSKVSYTVQGNQLLDCELPEFEDFVFAAVYIRQLTAKKDSLLKDGADRYCQFVDCQIRPAWVQWELGLFYQQLERDTFWLPGYSLHELFDAFLYGAGLMHKIPPKGDRKREHFLEIYDKEPRAQLLYALHTSLMTLMNHVNNIKIVIYRDYSNWLPDYDLPAPDTRWHDRLFEIKELLEKKQQKVE